MIKILPSFTLHTKHCTSSGTIFVQTIESLSIIVILRWSSFLLASTLNSPFGSTMNLNISHSWEKIKLLMIELRMDSFTRAKPDLGVFFHAHRLPSPYILLELRHDLRDSKEYNSENWSWSEIWLIHLPFQNSVLLPELTCCQNMSSREIPMLSRQSNILVMSHHTPGNVIFEALLHAFSF